MELVRNWIITIVSVIIFVTFIEIIIPDGKSKKYINVVIGLLIIVVILSPLLHIFREGINLSDTVVQASNDLESFTTKSRVENIQYHQEELVLEIYRKNLEDQMINRIERTTEFIVGSISLDINTKSDNFGTIDNIEIYLNERGSTTKTSSEIEPIVVEVNLKNHNQSAETKAMTNHESRSIKYDFSSFYNIPEENINIYIQHKKTSEED